eukprot:746331-Hanusia_phi.AAC.2
MASDRMHDVGNMPPASAMLSVLVVSSSDCSSMLEAMLPPPSSCLISCSSCACSCACNCSCCSHEPTATLSASFLLALSLQVLQPQSTAQLVHTCALQCASSHSTTSLHLSQNVSPHASHSHTISPASPHSSQLSSSKGRSTPSMSRNSTSMARCEDCQVRSSSAPPSPSFLLNLILLSFSSPLPISLPYSSNH